MKCIYNAIRQLCAKAMLMSEWIILKWHENASIGRQRWFLRRIGADGSFYGETQHYFASGGGRFVGLKGQLSEADNSRLQALAASIDRAVDDEGIEADNVEHWVGLFAFGPMNKGTILLRYRKGDETKSEAARCFLEIVELLRPYVRELYLPYVNDGA